MSSPSDTRPAVAPGSGAGAIGSGGGWSGSRRLLRLLRDIMKGGGSRQNRLDQVVRLIAQDMVAEVCSVYVMWQDRKLVLFATEGLRQEATHKTTLKVGEGLVGVIAASERPLALSDAQKHPSFAYRPETGEEIFRSLMGVPILRSGQVMGVVVVQNKTQRHYLEEEVEALETVAMVLAELLVSGKDNETEEGALWETNRLPARLAGTALTRGLAVGEAVLHNRGIVISQVVAENPEQEEERLQDALTEMREAIDRMLSRKDMAAVGEHRDVLETYRLFAEDHGWLNRIREAVLSGLTAEAAVQKVQNDNRVRMEAISDPYIRERLSDLEDLGNRLLHHLLDLDDISRSDLPDDMVLIARDLGPAELLDYDLGRLRAVALEEGSPTSHVAIMARALEIPVIGRCKGIVRQSREGDRLIVDSDNEQVMLRPTADTIADFTRSMAQQTKKREELASVRDLPSVTLDGHPISLSVNAGLLIDLPQLHQSGADGIGLYRTEIPFMIRNSMPNVVAQQDLYGRVLDHAREKPVIFRTLDIGGDKQLPYWQGDREENPALGWRSLRIGLDRPALLRLQLRALFRAAAGRELRVMFPMVSDVSEFEAARALLEREREREQALGHVPPARLEIGAMLEVPALVWQLPALFRLCDFVSLGSNDLCQFTFAADRGNPLLARRYDVLSPAILSMLKFIADQAQDTDCRLTLCGEMAGDPLEAMAILGCGFTNLSMAAPGLPAIKSMLRSLNLAHLRQFLAPHLESPMPSLRSDLLAYAENQDVKV
ncbi:MAG: phosphoenolpyruvate--protein phosphotransferase [Pseudomonadota bacterium]